MSDPLRDLFDKSKPSFEGKGRFARFFPLFDVFENLFYSSDRKTSGLTHVRDGSDIQRVMAIVWMATFPTMFFGMYNICLLYTSPSPRDRTRSRMPSSA